MQFQELLERFEKVRKTGQGYQALCPAHNDKKQSLSLRPGEKGSLLYCHAGCETSRILAAKGLEMDDLFYEPRANNGNGHHRPGNGHAGVKPVPTPRPAPKAPPAAAVQKSAGPGKILTTYDYRDEAGNLLYQVCRYEPKDFRQRRPDPERPDRWLWNLQNVRRVLYRLPEILAAHPNATIWIVEGEKDADALASLGLVATSSVGGAGKWRDEYAEALAGRDVVVIPDNDAPGRQHALAVSASLGGLARSIRTLLLPGLPDKGDVSDWLQIEGHDAERLCLLAEQVSAETTAAPAEDLGERTEPRFWRRTHEGLASELIARCGGNLRWVADFARDLRGDNAWAWWDGKCWTFDAAAVAHVSACQRSMTREYREHCRQLIESAGGIIDALSKEEKQELAFSKEIESAGFKGGWKSEIKAFGEIHCSINDFDKDPFLLTCANGVLDLRDGRILPFDRARMCSRRVNIAYDPTAAAPLWESFLDRIFAKNEGLIGYLRRAIGYSLTGDTSEQCLFLCHGPGANGKSVMLDVVLHLLGEFGMDAPMSTFTVKQQQSSASNDLAMLRAARYVTASETNEGVRLDEALVKKATGQDKLTARQLYQEFFSYQPQFKLWLAMNHKPSIRGVDNGIWRRIRLIPFSVIIPEAEQDRNLKRKLLAELPGILAWAVRGCLEWQRDGMQTPPEVIEATKDYRSEQDVLGAFLDECCILGDNYQIPSRQLYHAYRQWAEETGEHVMSQTLFGRRLGDRGFEIGRVHGGNKMRRGLALLNT